MAARTDGPEALVAPKRRKEAADRSGSALLAWLAEDMRRLRRPIIDMGGELTLGFDAGARAALALRRDC